MNDQYWRTFNGWNPPLRNEGPFPDWNLFNGFEEKYSIMIEKKYKVLDELIAKWNKILPELGGDPLNQDWMEFRPLRLTREEDWSDWLSHLIQTSSTGFFSKMVFFGLDQYDDNTISPVKVEREVSRGGYRADIVISWDDGSYSHMEIKIGDENLIKTYATGMEIMGSYPAGPDRWTHHILLLPDQLEHWRSLENIEDNKIHIDVLTWNDICISLRKALLTDEPMVWKVWAYSFLGAIEQKLLGFDIERIRGRDIFNIDDLITILRGGLKDGG